MPRLPTTTEPQAAYPSATIPEPPVVKVPIRGNPITTTSAKLTGWPWPNLAARSEEGRHKFFSIAFRQFALVAVPLFAVVVTFAIGYEVGTLGLSIIIPLSILSALAMGLGQTWILDNAYREGKSFWEIWFIPFFLQFYILSRWAICWRPMVLIALGGSFYVSLLFYLIADHSTPWVPKNNNLLTASQSPPQQASPFDSTPPVPNTRRSSWGRNSASSRNSNFPQSTSSQIQASPVSPPTNETVWTYESLAVPATRVAADPAESAVASGSVPSQPVLSPVFEEDDGFREWSNLTGSYKLLAKLDVVEGEFVQLKTRDGRRIRVEIAKLSPEDRRFLEPILQSSPFETVGGK